MSRILKVGYRSGSYHNNFLHSNPDLVQNIPNTLPCNPALTICILEQLISHLVPNVTNVTKFIVSISNKLFKIERKKKSESFVTQSL